MTERSIERSKRWFQIGLFASIGLFVILMLSLLYRVEWSAQRTGPQPWMLLNDGAITFGAGELAGGPGRPRWLVSFSPPGGMDVQLVPFLRFRNGMMLARLPLWIPFALSAIPTVVFWCRQRRTQPGRCAKCQYILSGHDSARCPECGASRPVTSGSA